MAQSAVQTAVKITQILSKRYLTIVGLNKIDVEFFFDTTTCTNLSVGSSCRSVEPGVTVLQPVSVCPDALCIFLLGVRGLCRIQKGEVSRIILNKKKEKTFV